MKPAKRADEGERFLGFIPVQVGPASSHARKVRHWMSTILLIQFGVCLMRFIFFKDFFGSFWMLLLIGIGVKAWSEDMNITYVCCWGLGCFLNGIFDTLGLIIPLVFNLICLKWLEIPFRALIPVSELLGAAFAWHLYLDYYSTGGGSANGTNHQVDGIPDPMGKIVEEVDPYQYGSMLKGKAADLGSGMKGAMDKTSKDFKALQKQAQKSAEDAQAKTTEGADSLQEKGQGMFSQGMFATQTQQLPGNQKQQEGAPARIQKQAPCC